MSVIDHSHKLSQEESLLYLEKEGLRYTNKIAKAVRQVPLTLKALQLIWTAGPVTYIALQGGYFMGFGKTAPWQTFVYFGGYTLIAGFIGITATVLYHAIEKPKQDKTSFLLTQTISQLTDLLAGIRDLKLTMLEIEYRKLEGARLILENTHADPEAIFLAVKDITNHPELANTAAQIEVFRRAGLQSRIQDCYQEHEEKIIQHTTSLAVDHPHLSHLLMQRFSGYSPTVREGLPRNEHFISRLLMAHEEENELLITPRDIEELLILLLELLLDREFLVLAFSYQGQKKFSLIHDSLQSCRKAYQVSLTTCRSQLKALYVYLASIESSQLEFVPFGIPSKEQIKYCHIGLENLYQTLKTMRFDNRSLRTRAFKKRFKEYKKALELYKKVFSQTKKIKSRKATLHEVIRDWEALSEKNPDTETQLRLDKGHGGLRVSEHHYHLEHDQKVQAVYQIKDALESFHHYASKRTQTNSAPNIDDYKNLAVELATIVAEYLPLDNPMVQYAIESSPATNMLSIEVGTTAKTKVGFLSAMVHEIDDNSAEIAKGFAKALTEQYGIELNRNIIEFLEHTYDADPDVLLAIKQNSQTSQVSPIYASDEEDPSIPAPAKHWIKLANQIDSQLTSI